MQTATLSQLQSTEFLGEKNRESSMKSAKVCVTHYVLNRVMTQQIVVRFVIVVDRFPRILGENKVVFEFRHSHFLTVTSSP